jgi:hypothetical protein
VIAYDTLLVDHPDRIASPPPWVSTRRCSAGGTSGATSPGRPRSERTIVRRKEQIAAWHRAQLSNGPTDAANNLIKRIKRLAFGLTRFRNHRTRGPALRRPAELGRTRHPHTLVKSEEPV